MIHILYLAAGQSRRYGSNKLLSLRDGKCLYRHGLDTLRLAAAHRPDCTLTVITCWDEIRTETQREGIRCVLCPDSHRGISYTIRCAVASCGELGEGDYLLFSVADQPNLSPSTVQRLLDAADAHPLTACLSDGEVQGNPVLFASSLAGELCALEGDRGGKSVMRRHPENHIDIPCDPAELTDVDTPHA